MRKISLFATALVAVLAVDSLPAQTWTMSTVVTSPSPRRAGAMAFDAASNQVVIYGGTIAHPGQITAEMWRWNGITWNPIASTAPARWGHQLTRDTSNGDLLTFGGRSPSISGLANDTWRWNGSTWTQLTPVIRPPQRFRYGMCYDSWRDRFVMFGGRVALGNVNDTWEFDGLNWIERLPATSPQPREDMVMVFDASVGTTVLFGGFDNDTATLLGDTWEYRGSDWYETTPVTSPTPRYRMGGIYNSTRQRAVMYGGHDGIQFRTETYEYAGSEWTALAIGPGPLASTEFYVGFDENANRTVTFGGVGNAFSGETWHFVGAATAFFGAYGEGCPHSAGISTITGTPPVIGSQFDLEIINLPTGQAATIVVQGFSSTVSTLGPLPFDLSPFGVAGCALEAADDSVMLVLPDAQGFFTYGFAIPNDPTLLNLAYFTQAFVPDSGAGNALGGLSRPGRGIFGN